MSDNRPDRAVREPEREHITGVPCSTWRELQNAGRAPKPFRLTANTIAWSFNQLIDWVEARKAGREWRPADDSWQQLRDVAAPVISKLKSRAR